VQSLGAGVDSVLAPGQVPQQLPITRIVSELGVSERVELYFVNQQQQQLPLARAPAAAHHSHCEWAGGYLLGAGRAAVMLLSSSSCCSRNCSLHALAAACWPVLLVDVV
jgi:hypothetical protein